MICLKAKEKVLGILVFSGLLFLICSGKSAAGYAAEAVDLCLKSVIPSLLPFFLLIILLNQSLEKISVLSPLAFWMGMPRGSEALLISFFLAGYPLGAKTVSEYMHVGKLDRENAERMLFFCNNAGPAFFFGMLSPFFPNLWMVLSLWGIHMASSLAVSRLIFPAPPVEITNASEGSKLSVSQAMNAAIKAVAAICGWIICFRIIVETLKQFFLWRLNPSLQVLIAGLLELTNGCMELDRVLPMELRFILAAALVGFGGGCVIMQTASVLKDLPLQNVITGKILQSFISTILAFLLIKKLYIPLSILVIGFFLACIPQKNSRKFLKKSV